MERASDMNCKLNFLTLPKLFFPKVTRFGSNNFRVLFIESKKGDQQDISTSSEAHILFCLMKGNTNFFLLKLFTFSSPSRILRSFVCYNFYPVFLSYTKSSELLILK